MLNCAIDFDWRNITELKLGAMWWNLVCSHGLPQFRILQNWSEREKNWAYPIDTHTHTNVSPTYRWTCHFSRSLALVLLGPFFGYISLIFNQFRCFIWYSIHLTWWIFYNIRITNSSIYIYYTLESTIWIWTSNLMFGFDATRNRRILCSAFPKCE